MLRKGVVFKWTEQCNNAFNLLKSELVKMPRLQCLNPNKTFKLFTNMSKHSYSGIPHQEEICNEANAVPNLVLIAYSWAYSVEHYNCGTPPKGVLQSLQVNSKMFILFSRHKMHTILQLQPLALFFTMGMSSPELDHWALELQQFDIQFKHISCKKNVVVDAISRLTTLGLY